MLENFVTAFIICFMVTGPVDNAPIFLSGLSVQYAINRPAAIGLMML